MPVLNPTFRTRSLLHRIGVEHFTVAKITFWSLSQGQKLFVLFPWNTSKIASVSLVHSHYVGSKSEKVKLAHLKLFLSKIFPRIFDETLG